MNDSSPFEIMLTSLPFDLTSNTAQIDPPTPTSATTTELPCNGERLCYDQLLQEYTSLQSANKTLELNLATQRAQNDQWVKVYSYVEQGLTLKLAELNTLRAENQQLKVRIH
jgi:hypothetical protein